ncbi:VOC family protein [bacterium]|nr:VOC family protein [bacterium]
MADKIVWYEIIGKDANKAQSFYSSLFGWQFDNESMPGYGMTSDKETGIGGGIGGSDMSNGAMYSTFYVGVDDIDASIAKVQELGGTVIVPKMDVPNGPTIAMFNDPDGNMVGLVQNQPM